MKYQSVSYFIPELNYIFKFNMEMFEYNSMTDVHSVVAGMLG